MTSITLRRIACLFIVLAVPAQSAGRDFDNGVVGTPTVECERDFIRFSIGTEKPFRGKVFVKGEYTDRECLRNYAAFARGESSGGFYRGSASATNPGSSQQGGKQRFSDSGKANGVFSSFETPSSSSLHLSGGNAATTSNDRAYPTPSALLNILAGKNGGGTGNGDEYTVGGLPLRPDANGNCPLVCPPCLSCPNEPAGPKEQGIKIEHNDFDDSDLLILTPRRHRRQSNNEAGLDVKLGTCNARRDRTVNPPGLHVSFTVVVSFHENFITKVDKAYHISCSYEEVDRTVTTQIDVSTPPAIDIVDYIDPPKCQYGIVDANGKPVANAIVGQSVRHEWNCTSGADSKTLGEAYGLLVHDCYIEDGRGRREQVVDSRGCSKQPLVIGTPIYSTTGLSASITALVVKFPDRDFVDFQCSLQICLRAEGNCDTITPPVCNSTAPTTSRAKREARGHVTRENDWRLHANRITVFDNGPDLDRLPDTLDFILAQASPLVAGNFSEWEMQPDFCVSVAGFGFLVAALTFLVTSYLAVLIAIIFIRNSKPYVDFDATT